mmetsp:Transcript_130621/g.260622  ORF Transcript_130621/g.260622 Transcript_130621/m.260622 type:complete len:234 (+) Transcript_130621:135-836(+)
MASLRHKRCIARCPGRCGCGRAPESALCNQILPWCHVTLRSSSLMTLSCSSDLAAASMKVVSTTALISVLIHTLCFIRWGGRKTSPPKGSGGSSPLMVELTVCCNHVLNNGSCRFNIHPSNSGHRPDGPQSVLKFVLHLVTFRRGLDTSIQIAVANAFCSDERALLPSIPVSASALRLSSLPSIPVATTGSGSTSASTSRLLKRLPKVIGARRSSSTSSLMPMMKPKRSVTRS